MDSSFNKENKRQRLGSSTVDLDLRIFSAKQTCEASDTLCSSDTNSVAVLDTGRDGVVKVSAAMMLEVSYLVPDGPNEAIVYPTKPEFTHQIFEDEEILLLRNSPPADDVLQDSVRVLVDLTSLATSVQFQDFLSGAERAAVLESLCTAVPNYSSESLAGTSVRASSPHSCWDGQPTGELIHTFSRKNKLGEEDDGSSARKDDVFDIYLATAKDANACELLACGEKLALWSIETADSVDFSDSRWEALFLFRREENSSKDDQAMQYCFCGYVTLFTFHNPFAGSKLRVCQALVLPPFQSVGLGRELMKVVYDKFVMVRESITELTVEDPCIGFSRLRDSVDFDRFIESYVEQIDSNWTARLPSIDTPADKLACELKITLKQAQFVLEAYEFLKVQLVKGNEENDKSSTSTVEEEFVRFRLRVKKRLLNENKDLKYVSKEKMKQELAQLFAEETERFDAAVCKYNRNNSIK